MLGRNTNQCLCEQINGFSRKYPTTTETYMQHNPFLLHRELCTQLLRDHLIRKHSSDVAQQNTQHNTLDLASVCKFLNNISNHA